MSSEKFPISHRLNNAQAFDRVFKTGDFRVSRPALLVLAKRNTQGFNRLGMVVSKKSVPLAVRRNKIKRQIREQFRMLPPISLDIVILTRAKIRDENSVPGLLEDCFLSLSRQLEN